MPEMQIDLKELYMLIGEREVIKHKLQQVIDNQQKQITELNETITKLQDSTRKG